MTERAVSALLLIVVSAVIGVVVLLTRRWAVVARALAPAGSGFLALLAGGAMLRTQAPETISWLPSIDLGGLFLPLDLGTSRPLAAISFVVALVSAAVQIYSTWYLRDDDRYPVFAATVALFTAAMFLVVHSRDLALTLVGWEVMGWCSYLLIGHWSRKESARRAAHKAFLVTRLADVGFVLVWWASPRASAPPGMPRCSACGRSRRSAMPTAVSARIRCCAAPSRPHHRRSARQVGPGALPGLVARRDGGPDAGVGAHPRRDDGRRRHRRARRALPGPRPGRGRPLGARHRDLGDHGACGPARHGAERPQTAARVVDGQPGRHHAVRAGCCSGDPREQPGEPSLSASHPGRPWPSCRAPRSSTCGPMPSSSRCSSWPSACSASLPAAPPPPCCAERDADPTGALGLPHRPAVARRRAARR
ncbi:MAG: hypothetical protein IPM00_08735, partial [Tetrasphaera sp.]|nr:hypothetical protein [Tetrasphaera sp.]